MEHCLNFHFQNYKVGGSNNTPGLDGVDDMDLDHNITQSIHIISNEGASNVLSSVELGF